jgi:hypothetical protein
VKPDRHTKHVSTTCQPHHARILAALREGPQTTLELSIRCGKLSVRDYVADLRAQGYNILPAQCVRRGVFVYRLVEGDA